VSAIPFAIQSGEPVPRRSSKSVDVDRLRPVGPKVSRLYRLEPIGIGTAQVEGLDSYFIRLAAEHCVSPRDLVRLVLIPASRDLAGARFSTFHSRYARTLCGLGPYATRFSDVLNHLAHREDLKQLTLLPWRGLFSTSSGGPTARFKQWCPTCVAERRACRWPSYRPLVWSLAAYQVCPTHQRLLVSLCARCGARQSFIPSLPVLDCCEQCGAFLGLSIAQRSVTVDINHLWDAAALSDLAEIAAGEPIGREEFLRKLQELIDRRTAGNRAAFCRAYGLPLFMLKNWYGKEENPSLSQFLRLCRALHVMPRILFSGGAGLSEALVAGSVCGPARRHNARPDPEVIERMRNALSTLSKAQPIPALVAVAKQLGVTRSSFLYWLPKETAVFTRKRLAAQVRGRRFARKRVEDIVLNAIEELRQEGQYPSWRRIDQRLKRHGMSLWDMPARTVYQKSRVEAGLPRPIEEPR